MLRIPSISTPVSPLSSVVSSPYKSALTHANNSLANASGVPHQRQGAKIGTGNFREDMYNVDRLFQFIGAGLPFLTSEGQFDIQAVIKVARQYAKTRKNNPTFSQLWGAVAILLDPNINKDLTVVINENTTGISITSTRGFADFKEFQKSTFYDMDQGYPSISIEDNYTYSAFKRGAKRAEHLKGLNSLNRLLSDYQAYLDSLKTESPLS